MPAVRLPDRACVLVTGPEAEAFLQNILTLDLGTVQPGEARPGALLTPQGKILFDFLAMRVEDGFRLDCRADIAGDFVKRLGMYRLRAKVAIAVQDESLVGVSWGDAFGPSGSSSTAIDRRFPEVSVQQSYGIDFPATDALEDWTAFRINQGVAESGDDYELGDAFPHDVLLDQNGGVGFKKGCYVGQEVVSRMQHRGTARRRVLIATSDMALPPAGTEISVEGRLIGTLGSAAGSMGLALVRIDKVGDALDRGAAITAGGATMTLSIPAWARFAVPDAASAQD